MKEKFIKWLKAAGIRALKTAAQTAAASIDVAAVMQDVDWAVVGSTALHISGFALPIPILIILLLQSRRYSPINDN